MNHCNWLLMASATIYQKKEKLFVLKEVPSVKAKDLMTRKKERKKGKKKLEPLFASACVCLWTCPYFSSACFGCSLSPYFTNCVWAHVCLLGWSKTDRWFTDKYAEWPCEISSLTPRNGNWAPEPNCSSGFPQHNETSVFIRMCQIPDLQFNFFDCTVVRPYKKPFTGL